MNATPPEDKPPILKSWSQWYWIVITVLAVQVLLYYWITESFS